MSAREPHSKSRLELLHRLITVALALIIPFLDAAGSAQAFDLIPDDFFTLDQPSYLDVSAFTGGFVSEKYGQVLEGIEADQSLTPYVKLLVRATGYQGFAPGAPGEIIHRNDQDGDFPGDLVIPSSFFPSQARPNIGRFQGGFDLNATPDTHIMPSAGIDVGSDSSPVFEVDFDSWLLAHTAHPLYVSASSLYVLDHQATSNSIDFEFITASTENWLALGGVGGVIYKGSLLGGFSLIDEVVEAGDKPPHDKFTVHLSSATQPLDGQGGVDIGFYYRPWNCGIGFQIGYGSLHEYGQVSIYKELTFLE